ncbi:MAG: hypothetical protein JST54_16065 [Deltaproteobacteria bacterium]|nr:hypothetical protein [Deltaproteobacteria bacterium]
MRHLILASVVFAAVPAFAEEPGSNGPASTGDDKPAAAASSDDADTAAAKKVLTDYLDLLVKKKWDPAKKDVHPKTLELIAGIKKRLGKEQHEMAPQYWAKDDFYLKSYTIDGSAKHMYGTISFDVKAKNYRVQEKGEDADAEPTSYLLGKKDGKWLVTDKKTNGSFEDKSIKFDYKGYFDIATEPKKEQSEEPESKE